MKKTLLIIGERKVVKGCSVDPSCNAFIRHLNGRVKRDATIKVVNYRDVFADNLPKIKSSHVIIALFFPFQYWNKNIEVYNKDSRVYGDTSFGRDFGKFFQKLEKVIIKKYYDKKVEYVNPPKVSVLDRDKEECKNFFKKHSLPIPKSYDIKSLKDVQKLLDRGISLYIKPRFGSMGKGISYLSNDLLMTNFLFQKGKVISHPYDYNWRFHEITKQADKNKFLKIMIQKGFIFEIGRASCRERV